MDAPLNQVIIPSSFQELFLSWNRFPDAVPYAGGTILTRRQKKNSHELPPVYLCLDKIPELHHVTRTEHYLEIGSMVKLNRIINLGKIVPEILRNCLENIAGFQVRNIATIGGNICAAINKLEIKTDEPSGQKTSILLRDIPAPLIALDAQYELKNSSNSAKWVSAARFHSPSEQNVFEKNELLSRIRLPLYQWDYAVYKKFSSKSYVNTEALVFLAKIRKNILSEIRVLYKTDVILRNKTAEDILNGKFLPLHRKTADDFIENWKEFLNHRHDESDFSKNTLLNGIQENVYNLSE